MSVENLYVNKLHGNSFAMLMLDEMRYDRMVMEIARYDKSLPRMNPVSFVNHLCATYKVDSTSAIRRVQEVRAMKARKKY